MPINILCVLRIADFISNQTFWEYYTLFQDDPDIFYLKQTFIFRFGGEFLEYVVRGNKEATEAILEQCPEMISYRGNVQFKNRTFTHVSALELIGENIAILDIILSQKYDKTDADNRIMFGNALLYYTIRRNQEAVVKILRYCPSLLTYRGHIVDYTGREFKHVTVLELTTWALNLKDMMPTILKCVTDNADGKDYSRELIPELQQQFDNAVKDGGGVNYTIGCGLLKMSQDPSTLLPGQTNEEKYAALNRKLNRHDGFIQYKDKLFYFHNRQSPKKLVEMTNDGNMTLLQGLLNTQERNLDVDTLQIITNDDELKMIQEYVPDSRHVFREKHCVIPLLQALELYVDSYETWSKAQRDAHWCSGVGLAQHYALAYITHSYGQSIEMDPWRLSSVVSGSNDLGLDFGILRATQVRGNGRMSKHVGKQAAALDLAFLIDLSKMNTPEMLKLRHEQLPRPSQNSNSEPEPTSSASQLSQP